MNTHKTNQVVLSYETTNEVMDFLNQINTISNVITWGGKRNLKHVPDIPEKGYIRAVKRDKHIKLFTSKAKAPVRSGLNTIDANTASAALHNIL